MWTRTFVAPSILPRRASASIAVSIAPLAAPSRTLPGGGGPSRQEIRVSMTQTPDSLKPDSMEMLQGASSGMVILLRVEARDAIHGSVREGCPGECWAGGWIAVHGGMG